MLKFPKGWLTLEEAARKYPLDSATLRSYINDGKIEGIKKGKTWFTTDYILEAYFKKAKVKKHSRGKI